MIASSSRPMAMGVPVQTVSSSELYEVIVGASSQDISRMQTSSRRLKTMLDMFGTFDTLQEIAARTTIPLVIRQQAMIQLKNSVTQHWRSRKLLSDDHRMRIRQRSLGFIDEEDDTIAKCNQIIVSKLARIDFPALWPTLISDLVKVIDSILQKRYISLLEDPVDTRRAHRSLSLLNKILKEFASIKLPNGIKAMGQMVEQLRELLFGYYSKMCLAFSASSLSPENFRSQKIYDDILLSHLVYKCLVRMATWLWNKMGRLSATELEQNQIWIVELFQGSATQVQGLAKLRKSIVLSLLNNAILSTEQTNKTISMLTRHLRMFGKFFRRLQQLASDRFALLPSSEELVMFYWSQVEDSTSYPQNVVADSDNALFPVRFLVQGLVLFKDNIPQWAPLRRSGEQNKTTLPQDFVEKCVTLLVTRFMPLNTTDLENWMTDPEEWVNLEEKENDQWEFEIRACSERVLVQLANHFSNIVIPLLSSIFVQIAPQHCSNLQAVVQKEAIYCAIGRCANRLKDSIAFETWLETTFLPEAHSTDEKYPIIKRRIAWLIGKWVSESCASPNNPITWQILVYLLQDRGPGTDAVVRLTAASSLRECIDTANFDPNGFEPFLTSAIPQLLQIMAEAETLESKRKVDESLNTIIEQSGSLILPLITVITQPIPQFWISAGDDFLFKGSLLDTMTKLVEAVKERSTPLGPLVVPLIRESLSPKSITQLDADALSLWIASLRNTVSVASIDGGPCLRDLFPDVMILLATNLDLLGSITRIIESYFLLDADYILKNYAGNLFRSYLGCITSKVADLNAKELLQSLSLLVQLTPANLWAESMHTSGLFPHLLKILMAGEADTLVLTEHIYLFSRIAMTDCRCFLQLMSASSPVLHQTESVLYDHLLDQWWGKFDNMSEPRHRKLTAMGIAALVSTGHPAVLIRIPGEIFNLWLDVFGELKEAETQAALQQEADHEAASPAGLVRFWELDQAPASYFRETDGTPEYNRRQSVHDTDPLRTTKLIQYVGSQLREAESNCGPANFQVYLDRTDPTVLKQIQDALTRT